MPFLIFDLILAVVLIVTIFQGYRKGFIMTLCGFLAVFVAFLGATILSDALAEPVSQMVRPAIELNINSALQDSLDEQGIALPQGSASSQEDSGLDILGENFSLDQILELLGDSTLVQHFSDAIHGAVTQGVLAVTSDVVASIAGYIAFQIAHSVLFVVCFALVLVAWHFLSRTLNLAFKLPVLSTLNHWAGAAMGFIKGAALLFIACWLLRSLIPQEAVDGTVLLHFFCTTNPFALMASFF